MKLTPAQVQRTLDQFEAQVIPESNPVVSELTSLFGDHTFFLDSNGLNIVERVSPTDTRQEEGRVINVANWVDASWTRLSAHEPEMTEISVQLAA